VKLFVRIAPASVPRVDEVGVNGTTLAVALVITMAAMLLSGVSPMVFTSRVTASDVLRSGSRQSGGRRVRKLAEGLVVAQIALATVSLTAAGLVTRGFIKLQTMGVVFEPEHLLAVTLVMRPDQLGDDLKQRRALEMAVAAAEALPGVRGVTPVFTVPFVGEGGGIDGRVAAPEQSAEERAGNPVMNLEVVAPNYFAMLGIPVLRGRSFTDGDREGSAPVIVISSAVARHFWPDSDPIGKQLVTSRQSFTVAGVVPDTRYRELETAWPTVYFPLAHSPLPVPSTLIIRAGGAPASLVPAVRHAVSEIPGLAVLNAVPFGTLLDAPRAQPRLNAIVIALFALAAIALAAIGLLAVIATMVRQRTREFGIRMALGATSGRVRGMIMLRGLSLATAGAAIGTAGALAAGRALSALLFEISPTDTATCFGVAALVLGVAAIASFLPAQRTMRSDPIMALRRED
jgi:predicted permease